MATATHGQEVIWKEPALVDCSADLSTKMRGRSHWFTDYETSIVRPLRELALSRELRSR